MSLVRQKSKNRYQKAFFVELIMLAFCFLICLVVLDEFRAWSFLFGACGALLPQCVFILHNFSKVNATPQQSLHRLFQAQGLKLILTIGIFVLIFMIGTVNPIFLFLGYFLGIVLNSTLPFFMKTSI